MEKADGTMDRMPSRRMPGIKHFQPGELITAERLNEIIDAIETLQERIRKLEERNK